MHHGEFAIDDDLVRDLISDQFPQFAGLPVLRVPSSGTAHAMFRLGDHLVARLPRHPDFSDALKRETEILPVLASFLPLEIPELVAVGSPKDGFASVWSVLKWIEGASLGEYPTESPGEIGERLGEFVVALREIELPGPQSTNTRGQPIASNDQFARESMATISDIFDPAELTAIWEEALDAAGWDGERTWIHGDLLPGNLLLRNGILSAVIDFGEASLGNPTCDLVAGWWVFDGNDRSAFREAAEADEASWSRAKGWALSGAVGALAYYRDTNPEFAAVAARTLHRLMADV